MTRPAAIALVTSVLVGGVCSAVAFGSQTPQRSGGPATYQVVKVCSLLSLADVKKLAPWPPQLDSFAKAEEQALGTYGSSCNYPTATVQVMVFSQRSLDYARKIYKLDPVAGVGDEAFLRNNQNNFAELMVRVGPHLLTVQLNIGTNQTYETAKPTLVELGKAFAAKLR